MTLDKLRPVVNRLLDPFVQSADEIGLTPDVVSLSAFVLACAAGVIFYLAGADPRLYVIGAFFVFGNGWLDLVDGALARKLETASKGGDLLDHVLDRYADIIIVSGLAIGSGHYGLGLAAITGVLMTSYLGTQSMAVGLDRVYGGVLGRADRLALIGIVSFCAGIYPEPIGWLSLVGWLLVILAIVGHTTAIQRFYYAMRELE